MTLCFVSCVKPAPVRPPENPKRIVSLSPSTTEILFAVGAGDRVVGDTIFCNYPPEAKNLPKVGEFSRVYFEKILSLMPDLVVANRDSPSETVGDSLLQYGVPHVIVGAYTIDETVAMIRELGADVGNVRQSEDVAASMERRIKSVESKIAGLPRVKTLLVFGHDPLIVSGPGAFSDDVLRRAGGENIASDSPIRYPRMSVESIVLKGPEVIIEASYGMGYDSPDAQAIREFWNQWPDIPAVKNGRVFVVNADLMTRPGPRIVDALEIIAKALHPEVFP